MFDFLNALGLPAKYAIICFVFGGVGVFMTGMFGYGDGNYLPMMIATGIGGGIAGYICKRRGEKP